MNQFSYKTDLIVNNKNYKIFDINKAANDTGFNVEKLPYTLRILFENLIRQEPLIDQLNIFYNWIENKTSNKEISFMPSRVLMQDFTGIPAVVDLAAMRDAILTINGDSSKINPLIPVDLVIDHSVQVDYSASVDAFPKNVLKEYQRNIERYEFLKWAQHAFQNFRVVPPGTGICHQVNLEYLSRVIFTKKYNDEIIAYPDSLVGTDSHTTMVNGLSVLGWGVGGIEAEAAMLGQPLSMILPEVIGIKIIGTLQGIHNATDLVLTLTQVLRKKGVVGKFVEFFGEGIANLNVADRATIANMSPEYGATCCFFPIDQETIEYLRLTGREESHIELIKEYALAQKLWQANDEHIIYTDVIEFDLSALETSLAGPKRPQDRISLSLMSENFKKDVTTLAKFESDINKSYSVKEHNLKLNHGSIVIAAITSCTNTSNPYVMVAAGLLAKAAHEKNLQTKPWVKTSFAPGSHAVTEYLRLGNLNQYLDYLGFNLVGYGCTTCIGNSGPLKPEITEVINDNQLVVASILSGNRNFEGRIHPIVQANYLASPPLVVAYAIAGDVNIDLIRQPLGQDRDGKDIYLHDIWPSMNEIKDYIKTYVSSEIFKSKYKDIFIGDESWQNIKINNNTNYNWNHDSSYINKPPFFNDIKESNPNMKNIIAAKILVIMGDSITTDHISPAGTILSDSPAGRYLMDLGTTLENFNSYGARRGNHEVMMRGTLANMRIRNEMCQGKEGGITINQLTGEKGSIYDVSMEYIKNNIPTVIFAGKEYGTGSSRDWAAKGIKLLGVKAVIAESFERIHRANLVGMGVLPLLFPKGMTRNDLNLDGTEEVYIEGLEKDLITLKELSCTIKRGSNIIKKFDLLMNVLTDIEIDYLKQGSIMHRVVRNLAQ